MNWYDLDEVTTKAEVPEVARRLGMEVERSGASLVAQCPFHADKRPSLVLYPRQLNNPSHFHCFACNEHGYAVDLVKKVQGVEFQAAVEWIARSFGISPKRTADTSRISDKSTREDPLDFAQRVFDKWHDEASFIHWCQSRRFEHKFLFDLGLRCLQVGSVLVHALRSVGFGRQRELIDGLLIAGLLVRLRPEKKPDAQTSLDLSDQFRDYFHDGRVLIPVRSEKNAVIGFAGRHWPAPGSVSATIGVPAKYLLTQGFPKSKILFNFNGAQQLLRDSINGGDRRPVLYIVEGFLDALRLQQLKLAAVAVMGTHISEDQRESLVTLAKPANLPGGAHLGLRLFFDRDAAGFDGASRGVRQLLGLPGVATEWIGFANQDSTILGKDPDEIVDSLSHEEAKAALDEHALPAVGILVAAGLGSKDATPLLSDERWNEVSRYPRERALLQTARALRALSGAATDWAQRLDALEEPRPQWVAELLELLRPQGKVGAASKRVGLPEFSFLEDQEARLNHARMLAEHGSRRGELPCDEETWRALDRNAQLFNTLALYRLKQAAWQQSAPCDAVHLPRKLSSDPNVLNDPRRKVMPHVADLHIQQLLMNELLTERHDFAHDGPRAFSDCIPAVRWFGTEGEVRVTDFAGDGEQGLPLLDDELSGHEEPVLSFAYQIDMDVVEGRRTPSDQGMFRPYFECWRSFMASLDRQARAIGPQVHVLRLDAKRYYDNIQRYVVRDRLLNPIEQALTISGPEELSKLLGLAADTRVVAERVVDLLCGSLFGFGYQQPNDGSTRHSDEVIGIPQGPVISAWIGTIAMFPVDAAARSFMRRLEHRNADTARPRVGYARYVDDIVLLADSEERLNALREAVQTAAAHVELTLVHKGESVAPGSPESVMRQLNAGRVLAPSVPTWEPPMVGDGESGWSMDADDVGSMDRQSALHMLRHPSLLDDPAKVHEKVRNAMRAPDLRPNDLGKCARALWWQVAMESVENAASSESDAWVKLWRAYRRRWDEVCTGHEWAQAFHQRGDDILFAVEGLDMLVGSNTWMETGRTQEWIDRHRIALESVAKAVLSADDVVQGDAPAHNRAHIQRRARMVQWKAMQRCPFDAAKLLVSSQQSHQPTLTDWLCQAAILLRRYRTETQAPPLETLQEFSNSPPCQGPSELLEACHYLKANSTNGIGKCAGPSADALKIALKLLVANTTDNSRWPVLSRYPNSLGPSNLTELNILPPLPLQDLGMLAYAPEEQTSSIRLFAFGRTSSDTPPTAAVGAAMNGRQVNAIDPIQLTWMEPEELAPGLYRRKGEHAFGLVFRTKPHANRAKFAADLYEVLYAIQRQPAGDGKEWVTVLAHLAHEPVIGDIADVEACKWYLISEPVRSNQLGVSAWVRDGRGGLRSVSVPGGAYSKLWRLGCAVSDALGFAFDLAREVSTSEEDEKAPTQLIQIEDFVLRQQLRKLRGAWISDAQLRDAAEDGLPRTIQRALDILRRFDSALDSSRQIRSVLHTEAETRSMAMRLQRKGASDLRDRLHLLPAQVLQRLPLSVLECMPLRRNIGSAPLRSDLAMLMAMAEAFDSNDCDDVTQGSVELGSAHALQIAMALACAGVALRGLVASAWGLARFRIPSALPERLPIPQGWEPPDSSRLDPQGEYDIMRRGLRDDNWVGLNGVTPWKWMLALLGILDGIAPQILDAIGENPLRELYEHLRRWQLAPAEVAEDRQWAWPYDEMPSFDGDAWRALRALLPKATLQIDGQLGLEVAQVEAPVFRRHRDEGSFTDAESRQWSLSKLQFTGLGSTDSVSRVQRGGRRLATWTEVRRLADDELLSVHTLDDKLGRWRSDSLAAAPESAARIAELSTELPSVQVPVEAPRAHGRPSKEPTDPSRIGDSHSGHTGEQSPRSKASDKALRDLRESQRASWSDRGKLRSPSHVRVALLQLCIEESYSHPLAEAGLAGMGMLKREREVVRKELLVGSALARIEEAAERGKEFKWRGADSESIPSWPEHRRRRILKRALDACKLLEVDLLVLPELSVRRDTVNWLQDELRQYPGLAVLSGTFRHFGQAVDGGALSGPEGRKVHHLMAPLTLLWRPDAELSKTLFGDAGIPPRTLRFWRGKKYRAVAANELFRPDWNVLKPLFGVDSLLDQLGDLSLPAERSRALFRAVAERMPALRYCMELICSELFLLTSPANVGPLRHQVATMLNRFPNSSAATAEELVGYDLDAVGKALSVQQQHSTPRRTILLVPAATTRSNDYWHAGQASVLASGTVTVFCNAANPSFSCGGSCFIGVDSATNPQPELPGMIVSMTPYHGWRKGILTAQANGALSDKDQALVVVDIDPVHVVSGKPRPQLLPEPMALVAYLPVVELLNPDENKVAIYQALSSEFNSHTAPKADELRDALGSVAKMHHIPKTVKREDFLNAFLDLSAAGKLDGPELDRFADLFHDPKAIRDRLRIWAQDRHIQPHPIQHPLKLEPAWLDFLDVDLTLKTGQELPAIAVPPWALELER